MFHGQNRATDDLNKAKLVHKFFHNVFSWKTKNIHQQFPTNFHIIIPCTRDQISHILEQLDISKSNGLDGIGNLILKQPSTLLNVSLHSVFKTCLNKGKYTSQWKEIVFTPL